MELLGILLESVVEEEEEEELLKCWR